MSHPYGVARTHRGETSEERERDPGETACAHQLHDAEEHREAGAEHDRAVEVRPEDEEWQHQQRARPDAAPRAVDEEPERGGKARKCGGLRAQRPAPRAGEDREEADEEGRARRRAAGSGRCEGEAEREQDERDPEEDHGAHAREPVGGVEDDLGEPLLVGPRSALAEDGEVLGVGEAVLDHLAARHERQPCVADDDRRGEHREEHDAHEADEEDREGARLEDAALPCGSGAQGA